MYHRPVCVKCQVEMRPEKSGVGLLDLFNPPDKPTPQPYQIWDADLYKCPECGYEIVVGFGQRPISAHYEKDFEKAIQRYKTYGQVIESRS